MSTAKCSPQIYADERGSIRVGLAGWHQSSGVQILFLSLAVTLACVPGNLVFAERKQDIPEVSKRLRKYDVVKLDPKSAASQIRPTGKLILRTSDRVFDLQLVPHDLRSHDSRSQGIGSDGVVRTLPRDPVNTYKGFVKQRAACVV